MFEAPIPGLTQLLFLWISTGHLWSLVFLSDWLSPNRLQGAGGLQYELLCYWVTRLLLLSMQEDYIVGLGAMRERCHMGNKLQKWAMPEVNLTRSCTEFPSYKFMSTADRILYYLPKSDLSNSTGFCAARDRRFVAVTLQEKYSYKYFEIWEKQHLYWDIIKRTALLLILKELAGKLFQTSWRITSDPSLS